MTSTTAALEIKNVLCKDVNFTTFHPKYAKVVCECFGVY